VGEIYATLFFISAGSLAFQVTLTRIFSLAQWYHFAFMAISLALLGIGASGSFLYIAPPSWKGRLAKLFPWFGPAFSASVLFSYLAANYIPFDSYRIAWEPIQYFYLLAYFLAISLPFFWSGLSVGVSLAAFPARSATLYAASLGGSALGCILPLATLPTVGGEGSVVACAMIGMLAWLGSVKGWRKIPASFLGLLLILLAFNLPSFLEIKLSPYKELSQTLHQKGAKLLLRRWNAFSRIDVVDAPTIHSAPGLSLSFQGKLPPQKAIFIDGSDPTPVTSVANLDFLDHTPSALPHLLRPRAKVLILEARGGFEVLTALKLGAPQITAVEGNPLVIWAVQDFLGEFSGGIYRNPAVKVVNVEGRSFLKSTDEKFDLIILSLADSRRVITSGAYSLSENYLYTLEAFEDYLNHLTDDGILVVHRWFQVPPSESLKVGALAVKALKKAGVENPAPHLIALRSWATVLILVGKRPFTVEEIERVKAFCRGKFDLVYYQGMREEEANVYNVLPEPYHYRAFLSLLRDEDEFVKAYPFDISPPTDDRPFFFHFFRWVQTPHILRMMGKVWLPFGGSGYLVLLILLGVAAFAAVAFIIFPLKFAPSPGAIPLRVWAGVLAYFGLLGIGYIMVEVPLIQKLILFLDRPIYAFSIVVASLLVSSGVGSLLSGRAPWSFALLAVSVLAFIYPWVIGKVFPGLIGLPLALRVILAGVILSPLGLLMGIPFPRGIREVSERRPNLIPWAWGVNGSLSVVGSILAAMLALSFGFRWALTAGSLAYLGTWLVHRHLKG
jgi:spermidine synthase